MKQILNHLSNQEIFNAIAKTSFFANLDTGALNNLIAQFTPFYIEAGSILMNEGEEGNSLYFVARGRLRAVKNYNQKNQQIMGEIGWGELIGEFALLTDEHRSATVVAMRDSVLLKLTKADFLSFIQTHPLQLLEITKHSLMRLMKPIKPAKNTIAAIAVIPAGQDDITYRNFANSLTEELTKIAPTLHLNYAKLPDHLKEDETLLANWLSEQENNFRYIVYEADSVYTPWIKLCLRQTDQILTVASAKANPACNLIEEQFYSQNESTQKAIELVLVHPENTLVPTQTARWCSIRRLQLHHHVRENSVDDFSRLTRYLTGRSIALVLSGGGARGLAHIGAYKAMVELGIPVDMVAGVSAGSIIGALIAQKKPWQEITEITRTYLANNTKFFDYTFPVTALLRGKNWQESLKKVYGENVVIEDLWLPFFCVSTNLSQNKPQIHRAGLLWKSIRASASLPAIAPPISTEEGDLLVDGGVMNNMPVDIMRESINGGKIIAVSASVQSEMHSSSLQEGELSGWHYAWQKFGWTRKNTPQLPNLAEIIFETLTLASNQHQLLMSQQADWFIQLQLQQYGMFDFKAIDKLVETGYKDAMESLKGFNWLDEKN